MATLAVNLPVMLDDFHLIETLTPFVKKEWLKCQEGVENSLEVYRFLPGWRERNCLFAPSELNFLPLILEIMSPKFHEILERHQSIYGGRNKQLRHLLINVIRSACGSLVKNPEKLRSCLDDEVIYYAETALKAGYRLALVAVGGGYGVGSDAWPLPEDFAQITRTTYLFSEYAVDYMAEETCPPILQASQSQFRIMKKGDFRRWIF